MNLAVDTPLLRLSAAFLSSRIAPLFDRTGRGVVIAAFRRSCYIELHGRVVAIVAAELLNGPLNLVAPLPSDRTLLHLPAGAGVAVRAGSLELAGRLRIDTGPARRWNPRIEPMSGEAARGADLSRALARIRAVLERDAAPESFARIEGRPPRAVDGMAELAEALRARDGAVVERAAGNLAGLGPGLTPSGDDVLAGALLAMTVRAPACGHGLHPKILASIRGRTTRIGEAYLEAAADGDAAEAWHRLIEILRRGRIFGDGVSRRRDEGSAGDASPRGDTVPAGDTAGGGAAAGLDAAVRQIMAFGETSGADMLAGFVLGMEALNPRGPLPE